MGEPAVKQATTPVQQDVQAKQAVKLLKDLNDLSQKSIAALNGFIGDVPPSMAQVIHGGLKAGVDRTDVLINIYKMNDSVKAYNEQIAKGNQLMAAKSLADIAKTVIQVTEKTLKVNIDLAMIIAQRQEMVGAVGTLKKVSEKVGYLGRAASAVGAIGGTIALIDAIERNDTGAALKAGVDIVEGLGNAVGGATPLGMALATPLKMVLIYGQVGGMLKSIRNQAIRDKTLAVIKKGDRLFAKAKVGDAYRNLYFEALANGAAADELQYRKTLMHDWGRQVGESMLDLTRSMEVMERELQRMRGREFTKAYDPRLQQRITDAADPFALEHIVAEL